MTAPLHALCSGLVVGLAYAAGMQGNWVTPILVGLATVNVLLTLHAIAHEIATNPR